MTGKIFQRLALAESSSSEASADDRTIQFVFATPNVALDGHRILAGAWESKSHDGLADFRNNPVFLWAHQQDKPPVGRVVSISEQNGILKGAVRFADYQEANTIFALYRDGFMRGASVSWLPIEFSYATGRDREPGAIDFKKVRLLEISAVPLPADASALSVARSLGLSLERETQMPIAERKWKCGTSRTLPIGSSVGWDAARAAGKIFEVCGFNGPKPDVDKARKAFLAYDSANPLERSSYQVPIATVIDGRLVAFPTAIGAAESALERDLPGASDNVLEAARAAIEHYERKIEKLTTAAQRASALKIGKRGLGSVSWLAYLLSDLGYLKESVEWEAEVEEDGSPVPQQLADSMKALGQVLIAMTIEEVNELLAEDDGEDGERSFKLAVDTKPFAALLRKFSGVLQRAKLNKTDKGDLEDIHEHACRSARLLRTHIDHYSDQDLSDESTRACMNDSAEAIHAHCAQTRELLRAHIDSRAPEDDGDGQDDEGAGDNDDGSKNDGKKDGAKDKTRTATTAEERRRAAAARRAKALIYDH